MTMFRVGPAGIPASLKTDMNSVLNKKFGTTGQNYPPNGWPDDVNLMGPLPEGTATGPIASISDGADRVPIKSWIVNIDPNLTGNSAIVATQGGKNLLAKEIVRYTSAMAALSECFEIHHGTYTVTIGTVENATNWRLSVLLMDANGNALTDNAYKPSNDLQLATNRWRFGSNTTIKSFTVNIVTDCYVRFFIELGDTSSSTTISNSFLDVGSASTSYSPYVTPTVSTVNLGQTIHGGSADVANGTGTGNIKVVTVNENSNLVMYSSAYIKPTSCDVVLVDNDIYPRKGETNQPDGLIGNYLSFIKTNIWNVDGHPDCFAINQNQIHMNFENSRIGVTDYTQETISSVIAKVKAYLQNNPFTCTVPVAETEITFDPIIPTPQTPESHSANFWADTGDSTVVYRRDIDLALQAVSGSRNLLMTSIRPEVSLDNDPEQLERTENPTEEEGDINNER